MSTKKDRIKKDAEKAFVKRVLALYHAELEGTSVLEDDRDVRAVAFGLAAITQALNDRKAKYSKYRLMEASIPHADNIVDAITRGFSHPIWTFIAGVRRFRTGKAEGVDAEMKLREQFAGITLAYCQAAGRPGKPLSDRAGAKMVANGITWHDHRFSNTQISTWITRHRPEAEKLSQYFLAEAAGLSPGQDGVRDTHSLADRVLGVGRAAVWHSSATVPVPRQKP
jgi:hypothetical protein